MPWRRHGRHATDSVLTYVCCACTMYLFTLAYAWTMASQRPFLAACRVGAWPGRACPTQPLFPWKARPPTSSHSLDHSFVSLPAVACRRCLPVTFRPPHSFPTTTTTTTTTTTITTITAIATTIATSYSLGSTASHSLSATPAAHARYRIPFALLPRKGSHTKHIPRSLRTRRL